MQIVEETAPDAEKRELIIQHLRAYNLAAIPTLESDTAYHALYVMDDGGEIAGGLWARRVFDWVLIELVFVPEALRGQHVGAALMARIEGYARIVGATGLYVDTYGFQARGFYEKQGYTCFATLEGRDPKTDKHLLRKYLT